MQDSTNEMRIMKRRGRPRKSKTDNSPIRKPKSFETVGRRREVHCEQCREMPDELQ